VGAKLPFYGYVSRTEEARLVRMVGETMVEFGMADGSLCLEITERAMVHDIESTTRTLAELKDVGVQTSIDDFGTGYAVLSHLKTLPIDTLKIDPRFVRDLGTNANDLAIIRAIIGFAEAFDLQLVAEGVETPSAALALMQHGCHRAQGILVLTTYCEHRDGVVANLALDANALPCRQPGLGADAVIQPNKTISSIIVVSKATAETISVSREIWATTY
jgi:EAL domain-containing protein (putative c-di-GMP-specific phosphodiesterase class I)